MVGRPLRVPQGTVHGYLMVTTITAGEGLVAFLFPPYLDTLGFPVDVIGVLAAAAPLAALASRLPAGAVYRPSRARVLLLAALATSAVVTVLIPRVESPLAFAILRAVGGLAYGVATTANLARFIDGLPP